MTTLARRVSSLVFALRGKASSAAVASTRYFSTLSSPAVVTRAVSSSIVVPVQHVIGSQSTIATLITPSTSSLIGTAPAALSLLQTRGFHIKKKTNKRKLTKKYKLKTHKGTAKRFFVTGTGKIMRWRAGKRNVLRTKSARQLRGLDKRVEIPKVLYKKYRRSLPYAF